MRKWEKWSLAKIAWHYLCQKNAQFRAQYLLWLTCFGGPKHSKPRKTIKNSGFNGNCPKPEMTLSLQKVFFGMGEKTFFTNCVFEKLCSSENTMFIEFSAKHSSCTKKDVCWKTRKFMKNSELFLNMAKGVFVVFFEVLMFLCVW